MWSKHKTLILTLSVFMLALGLRIHFITASQEAPEFRTTIPGLDMRLHWEGAKQIRAGTPDPCIELMLPSAPFHPYFVAACQSFLGERFVLHRLFRALIGSLSVVMLMLLVRKLTTSTWAGLLVALLMASLPSWIYFDTVLIKASPEIFMLLVTLSCILCFPQHRLKRLRNAIAFGSGLGILLSLLRFSQGGTVLYVLVLCGYIFFAQRKLTRKARLCIVLPMLLLVFGSQLAFKHRSSLFGLSGQRFLPVGGVHMRIGFQKGAIGTYQVIGHIPAFPLGHTFISRMAAESFHGRALTAQEADAHHIAKARTFIKENPQETLRILGRKLALFCNNIEVQGNHYLGYIQEKLGLLNHPHPGYGGLFVLAVAGAFGLARSRRYGLLALCLGLILSVLISNLVAFITWRYRLHATVAFALLAGFGLLALKDLCTTLYRDRRAALRRKSLWILLLCIALSAYVGYRPRLVNASKIMMHSSEGSHKKAVRAEKHVNDLAELGPIDTLSPRKRLQASLILHALTRYSDAYTILKPLAKKHPQLTAAGRQYSLYLLWLGDYEELKAYFRFVRAADKRSFARLIRSFDVSSPFWKGVDTDDRLIIQTLLRDLIFPAL